MHPWKRGNFYTKLQRTIAEKRLSSVELSLQVGIPAKDFRRLIKKDAPFPDPACRRKLADALGVEITDIFDSDGKPLKVPSTT